MKNWQTKDIIMTVLLALVFGLLYVGWNMIWSITSPLQGLGLQDLFYGFWFMAGTLVPFIIRRPGAALVAETLASLAEFLAGGAYGPLTFVYGLVQGGASEVIFASGRWKRYNLRIMILAGMAPVVTSFILDYFYYYRDLSFSILTVMFVARLVGSAILAGWLPRWLGQKLEQSGVVDSYAVHREQLSESV